MESSRLVLHAPRPREEGRARRPPSRSATSRRCRPGCSDRCRCRTGSSRRTRTGGHNRRSSGCWSSRSWSSPLAV